MIKENLPKISLLISTFNWVQALELSLKSVARQTVFPNEVLIADDGSRDDTKQLIEKMREDFPCPIVHVWHEDDGFRAGAIRNKAIAKAQFKYIIQIDGDIVIENDFIRDHLSLAKKGWYSAGSRVLINRELTEIACKKGLIDFGKFNSNLKNKLNAIRFKPLRNCLLTRYKNTPLKVRGCNFAYWRDDCIAVNGYNEDIQGWGAEDSELASRLSSYGIKQQFIKFGAVQYHLYHKENDRSRETENFKIYNETKETDLKFCTNGIDKYL